MSECSQPFVSVVTPVYNTEKYLEDCIESVLAQTYMNFEYIILNNKSTDNTLKIANQYAKLDSRIRVITNEKHVKQMENCNLAFRYISRRSKYCKVVHADDWLFTNCISMMVDVAEAHPSTGIVGSYRLDERNVNLDGLPYPSPLTEGKVIVRNYLSGGKYLFGSPSSLLIRSDLIRARKRFYDETTLHGDKIACLDILREADFGFVHQVLTYTRRHNESATSFIKKYETYKLGTIQALLSYGKWYFSDKEFNECLHNNLSRYYRFLARKILELKGSDFLQYHRKELIKLGLNLSYGKLAFSLFWEFLNFRNAITSLFKGLRNREPGKIVNPNEDLNEKRRHAL